MMFIMKFQMKL